MSTTIDSLDIQISTSAGESIEKINALADALERLKNSAKFGRTINNLKKLQNALNGVENPARDVARATREVATSQNDLVNALDRSNVGIMASISNFQTFFGVLNSIVQALSGFLAQAIEWDGIQFRFGQSFGEDAQEVYDWILKINDALGINVQEFMQYSGLYASLLNGFGLAQEKVTEIAVGLTELSYDIWAFSNDRFESVEEASEAIRSAITGEIEPIRNAGIALTEASLQEFIDSTHLAGISIEKLTEAQKAEVRYAAMVDSAMSQGIIGTYAREMTTAEGAVRSLSQSFKTLTQALGSLFIPLLQAIIPYITAIVELLTEAVYWLAQLLGINIQKINWSGVSAGVGGVAASAEDAASGMGDAAKAAKKLRDYTMGFDELNVISPNTGSAGGGGGVSAGGGSGWGDGLDLESIWDNALLEQASKRVDEVKEKIKAWLPVIATVTGLIAALAAHHAWPKILEWVDKIKVFFSPVKEAFKKAKDWVKAIATAFGQWRQGLLPVQQLLEKIFGSKAVSVISKFKTAISGIGLSTLAVIIAAVASVAYFLYENWEKVTEAVKKFFKENIAPKLDEIKGHFDNVKKSIEPLIDIVKELVKEVKKFLKSDGWKTIKDVISDVFEVIGGVIFAAVTGQIAGAFNALVGMVENVAQVFSGFVEIISGVIEFIAALFGKGDINKAWERIWKGVVDVISGLWGLVMKPLEDFVKGSEDWFNKLSEELVGKTVPEMINAIVDWFASLPTKILKPLKTFTDNVAKTVKDMWSSIKSWFNSNVAPKFTIEYWRTKFNNISKALREKLNEVKDGATEKWNALKKWFNDNVAPKFTVNYWKSQFDSIRSALGSKLDEAWGKVKDFFSYEKWKNKVAEAIRALKDNFKIPELPKIRLSWEYDPTASTVKRIIAKALGLEGWPKLKWSAYAAGGFPLPGEYFVARESGPELVGRIGNRSAVANNDQIVAAVSQGVYQAVVAAMSNSQSSDSDRSIVVYLDGKQIHSSVKKRDAQRGIDIMGNQLGYTFG